jgi:hypothetical protein
MSNVKYALATGNSKETVEIIKASQNKCTLHVKSYIAEDCGFAGVCEMSTDGLGPKFVCLLTT